MDITMPANKQKEMEEMGWDDAVEGVKPKFQNAYYQRGYKQGEQDKE